MKKIHSLLYSVFLILVMGLCFPACSSGTKYMAASNPAAVKAAFANGEWNFVAQYAMPSYGQSRPVNGYYTVVKKGDTLNVGLPYFGRVNSPSATLSTGNVMDFISKDFNYSMNNSQEGKWEIQIVPKDYREVTSLRFTFFSNGNASLDVSFDSRSAISYSGTLQVPAPKKP